MRKADRNGNHHVMGNRPKKDKYYIFSHLKNLDLNMFLYVVIEKKRGHRHEKEILGRKSGTTSVTGSQKGGYVEEEGD